MDLVPWIVSLSLVLPHEEMIVPSSFRDELLKRKGREGLPLDMLVPAVMCSLGCGCLSMFMFEFERLAVKMMPTYKQRQTAQSSVASMYAAGREMIVFAAATPACERASHLRHVMLAWRLSSRTLILSLEQVYVA